MRLLEGVVPSNCDIALFACTHQDNIQSSDSGIEQTFDWIMAKPSRRFGFLGDAIEAITTDDTRYQDDTTIDPIPLRQMKRFIARCQPIKTRGLAWLAGNHEFKLQRFGDLGAEMAEQLDIPYGGCAAKLLLKDKHGPIAKIYMHHPNRFTIRSNAKDHEQRRANEMAAVKRFLVNKAGDCAVMALAHPHRLIVVPPSAKLIIYDDGLKLKQAYLDGDNSMPRYIDPDRRWYASVGSYLRTMIIDHDGYAERAGYDPVELGFVIVSIRDRKVVSATAQVVD